MLKKSLLKHQINQEIKKNQTNETVTHETNECRRNCLNFIQITDDDERRSCGATEKMPMFSPLSSSVCCL